MFAEHFVVHGLHVRVLGRPARVAPDHAARAQGPARPARGPAAEAFRRRRVGLERQRAQALSVFQHRTPHRRRLDPVQMQDLEYCVTGTGRM